MQVNSLAFQPNFKAAALLRAADQSEMYKATMGILFSSRNFQPDGKKAKIFEVDMRKIIDKFSKKEFSLITTEGDITKTEHWIGKIIKHIQDNKKLKDFNEIPQIEASKVISQIKEGKFDCKNLEFLV